MQHAHPRANEGPGGPLRLTPLRRRGGVVTQRPAKPFTPVRFRSAPYSERNRESLEVSVSPVCPERCCSRGSAARCRLERRRRASLRAPRARSATFGTGEGVGRPHGQLAESGVFPAHMPGSLLDPGRSQERSVTRCRANARRSCRAVPDALGAFVRPSAPERQGSDGHGGPCSMPRLRPNTTATSAV